MDVTITAVVQITGKDGREWTKISFLKTNGEVGEKMFAKGEFDLQYIQLPAIPVLQPNARLGFDDCGRLASVQ